MKNRTSLSLTSFLAISLAGCASSTPDRKLTPAARSDASIEAKQVAAQEGSAHVTEVRYAKGDAALPAKETAKLAKLVEAARAKKPVRRAILIAWADQEMPADRSHDLDDAEVKLAEKRGAELENYFKTHYPDVKTDVINMAKRSGKLAEFLKTKEARIQDSLASADVPTDEKKDRTALPKASRAVVILKLKGEH